MITEGKETKKYFSRDDKGMSQTYCIWKAMTRRCNYHKNYNNCKVCEEWLDYQVFAKWLESNNFYGLGYQLDKDLLQKGVKTYSPDTCILLPTVINGVLKDYSQNKKHKLPIGVSYNKRNTHKKYGASVSKGKQQREYLGYYATPEEASAAYVIAKEAYVKELALEWKDKIEPRAFEALMNWTVY